MKMKKPKTDNTNKKYLRDTYLGCKEGRLCLNALIEKPHENLLLKKVAKDYFFCSLFPPKGI